MLYRLVAGLKEDGHLQLKSQTVVSTLFIGVGYIECLVALIDTELVQTSSTQPKTTRSTRGRQGRVGTCVFLSLLACCLFPPHPQFSGQGSQKGVPTGSNARETVAIDTETSSTQPKTTRSTRGRQGSVGTCVFLSLLVCCLFPPHPHFQDKAHGKVYRVFYLVALH